MPENPNSGPNYIVKGVLALLAAGVAAVVATTLTATTFKLTEQAQPALSAAGSATIYADSTAHNVQISQNGGGYSAVGSATAAVGGDLSGNLPNPTVTGGTHHNTQIITSSTPAWIAQNGPINPSIAWNGTTLVTVGNGTCSTSPDGITWTAQTIPASNWATVCWSPDQNLFCATANNGAGTDVVTSPTGVTWTARTIDAAADTENLIAVNWSHEKSQFLIINSTNGDTYTSPTGVVWTRHAAAYGGAGTRVVWSASNSIYCCLVGSAVQTSADGITWNVATSLPVAGTYKDIEWSPSLSLFCAVGTSSGIATSPNGSTWTARTSPISDPEAVVWLSDFSRFIIADNSTFGQYAQSTDGINWSLIYGGSEGAMTGSKSIVWAGAPLNECLTVGVRAVSSRTFGRDQGLGQYFGVAGTLNIYGTTVTTTSGAGALLFQSSPSISNPSLTTPALGIPSSGNLGNCTINASSVVGRSVITNGTSNGQLTASSGYLKKTGAYTLLVTDNQSIIDCDTSGGGFTVKLPNATVGLGWKCVIRKLDSSANVLTISRNTGTDGVNGAAQDFLITQQYATMEVISSGVAGAGAGQGFFIVSSSGVPGLQNTGMIFQDTTLRGNTADTAEDTMTTWTFPAKAFWNNTQVVRMTGQGTFSNTANTQTVRVYFGTQVLGTIVATASIAGSYRWEADVYRTGSNTQQAIFTSWNLLTSTTSTTVTTQTAPAQTDTAAITIKTTAQEGTSGTLNAINQLGMMISQY